MSKHDSIVNSILPRNNLNGTTRREKKESESESESEREIEKKKHSPTNDKVIYIYG